MDHFADRWLAAARDRGAPVCVGLDPKVDSLPKELTEMNVIRAVQTFCEGVLDAVAEIVPAVKIQSAYFEALGAGGVRLYHEMIRKAHEKRLLVIGDVKRNDIGSTAEAYARGHLGLEDSADAITVNGYLGEDGLLPFVDAAAETGRGVFVLVRTSNPSARRLQDIRDEQGKAVYEHAAEMVAGLGEGKNLVGRGGYSCVGAVVGATYPDEARQLRKRMAQQLFLMPGYGAQGASAADCAVSFRDGAGGIVNASRSVIYAFDREDKDWRGAVAAAAEAFAADIRGAVGG